MNSNNKNSPKVSIIMPVFNEEDTLKKTIKSVLRQSYKNFEFIIFDDCSRDNTYNILKKFKKKDSRIKIYKNKKNIGITKTLNKALKITKGRFIARIDGNDWWKSSKLRKQVIFLKKNPEYIIVGTNSISCNSYTKEKIKCFEPERDSQIRKYLLKGPPFVHSSIVFRKPKLKYNNNYETSQDYDLYFKLLKKGRGYNLQDFLTYRITHKKNSISLEKWKTIKKNGIEIRKNVFKNYPHSLFDYRYFLPDLITYLLPKNLKKWKNEIKKFIFFKKKRK